ncbi:MAG: class I SAM-dependent methyltransferase [Acidimicrobiia bacterium]|nr:class I SAM-dependent methyltransferase [Acidimicrobiia bacterium]
MEGFGPASYGDAFADVYDAWYGEVSDAEATADVIAELARESAGVRRPRVLELGVGTGRLALPIAARGVDVVGVDTSHAMLDRLRERDPHNTVATVSGDMVDDLPDGPFDVVLVAYNTLFNLESAERQAACFIAVAGRLAPGGTMFVEAFVPADPPASGPRVGVRSMTATDVVLSVSTNDPAGQRVAGQFIHLIDGEPVRLRPWQVRYCFPGELDDMAAAAGLTLAQRWGDIDRRDFTPESPRHVTLYRLSFE